MLTYLISQFTVQCDMPSTPLKHDNEHLDGVYNKYNVKAMALWACLHYFCDELKSRTLMTFSSNAAHTVYTAVHRHLDVRG